jgi:hypothetical protein
MKRFVHWKAVAVPTGFVVGPGSQHLRGVSETLTGPGIDNPIQFIVGIPAEKSWDDVVSKWVLECGVRVDNETDSLGFEEEWPQEVLRQFEAGTGQAWPWSSLG